MAQSQEGVGVLRGCPEKKVTVQPGRRERGEGDDAEVPAGGASPGEGVWWGQEAARGQEENEEDVGAEGAGVTQTGEAPPWRVQSLRGGVSVREGASSAGNRWASPRGSRSGERGPGRHGGAWAQAQRRPRAGPAEEEARARERGRSPVRAVPAWREQQRPGRGPSVAGRGGTDAGKRGCISRQSAAAPAGAARHR